MAGHCTGDHVTKQKPRPIQPSKDQINAATAITLRQIGAFETTCKHFLTACTIVGVAYVAIYLPIKVSAGQETTIRYFVDFVANLKLDVAIAWTTTAVASVWAWRERAARMKERAERDRRITELERRIDDKRTSSGLDVTGDRVLEHKK
jgi:hypothetical protein